MENSADSSGKPEKRPPFGFTVFILVFVGPPLFTFLLAIEGAKSVWDFGFREWIMVFGPGVISLFIWIVEKLESKKV